MKSIFYTFTAALFAVSATFIYPAAAGSDGEKCLAMVKKMVGVDASDKVIKLCNEGKSKEAMQAAMMGE